MTVRENFWHVTYLKLSSIQSSSLSLLPNGECVDMGMEGSLHRDGEVFTILFNHHCWLDLLSHSDNHFRSTFEANTSMQNRLM